MTVNVTFLVIYVPSFIAMWVGSLFSLSWNSRLNKKSAWISLIVSLLLSLLLALILTWWIFSMGLGWEVDLE